MTIGYWQCTLIYLCYTDWTLNLLALHLNTFFLVFPRRGHRLQRDEASKRFKHLKHAGVPHVHVYIICFCHLAMLIYYYLLTLLFTVSDKVDWRRHVEPQKTSLETRRPNLH